MSDKSASAASRSSKGGFAVGKLIMLLIVAGLIGGGVYGARYLLDQKEEERLENKYETAKRADFLVTVKLNGTLISEDTRLMKNDLEGYTTIRYLVEEGARVKGPQHYTVKKGDTLESIAKAHEDEQGMAKDIYNIRLMNEDKEIDWDNLPEGISIEIPGALLVEMDPQKLEERINSQEIAVSEASKMLSRAEGGLESKQLTADLSLKRVENALQNAELDLNKTINSTIKVYVKALEGTIAIDEKSVALAEKNLKAYTELAKLGFVSDVKVKEEELKRFRAQHAIEMNKAEKEAYLKFDKISMLSAKRLAVEEAIVNIKKTKVENTADLRDANSTINTAKKVLDNQIEKLSDLKEQMAFSRVYAPEDGTVIYYAPKHWEKVEPIAHGSNVRNGQRLIKLRKTKKFKVDLSIPQARRAPLRIGQKAWVKVEQLLLPGTLKFISKDVDSNRRGHSEKSYFKGELTIDTDDFPEAEVSEGMQVRVEIQVVNLTDDEQLIKLPNQCVTAKMISEDTAQTGCFIFNRETGEHEWRPVEVMYSDEKHIAIADGAIQEGELVLLSPLSEAKNLNLEEAVTGKGNLDLNATQPDEAESKPAVPEGKWPDEAAKILQLNEEQKLKWIAADAKVKEGYGKIVAKMKSGEIPREKGPTEFAKLFKAHGREVKQFLTAEQFKTYEKKQAERFKRGGR